MWFDAEMEWFAAPDGRPGRPLRFSDRAIEFCLTLKGLFQLPLRQVTGLTQSLLRMAGLDWPAPDYTTLCRRQKSLAVDLGGRPSAGGQRWPGKTAHWDKWIFCLAAAILPHDRRSDE